MNAIGFPDAAELSISPGGKRRNLWFEPMPGWFWHLKAALRQVHSARKRRPAWLPPCDFPAVAAATHSADNPHRTSRNRSGSTSRRVAPWAH